MGNERYALSVKNNKTSKPDIRIKKMFELLEKSGTALRKEGPLVYTMNSCRLTGIIILFQYGTFETFR